jgi:hypothetical protein
MKTSEHSNKGLHSPMHKGIPSANGKPSIDENNQDNGPSEVGEPRDMSHIEAMVDDMDDEEKNHAHQHLSKHLAKNKPQPVTGENIEDFAKHGMED